MNEHLDRNLDRLVCVLSRNPRHSRGNAGPPNVCARCNGGPTQGFTRALLTCALFTRALLTCARMLGRNRCVSRIVHEPVFGAVSLVRRQPSPWSGGSPPLQPLRGWTPRFSDFSSERAARCFASRRSPPFSLGTTGWGKLGGGDTEGLGHFEDSCVVLVYERVYLCVAGPL